MDSTPVSLFKVDNQQDPTVQHMELCSMLCGSLDGRKFGGEWIHVYVWLSPFAVHLKLSQHCQLATLQYKIKSYLKKLLLFLKVPYFSLLLILQMLYNQSHLCT